MKKILLPFLSLLMAFSANAQNFLTPANPETTGKASDFELIIDGEFENNGAADSFIWVSTNLSITKGWGIAICDNLQCYDTSVRTKAMYAPANSKLNFDVHAYPYGIDGKSVTKIVVYRKSNMADSAVNTYTVIAEPNGASVKKVKASSNFELYPNPSRDELTVNFETNKSVEMKIFNVLGVEVMNHYHITSESKINVSQLQSGVYFLKFVDASGKAYVKSFKKVN